MRTTLITGAGSGLGRALVARLSGTDRIIAAGRDAAAMAALSGVAETVRCDLGDVRACETLLDGRPVDVLINNAGVLPARGRLDDMPATAINAMVDINFRAVIHLTRLALRAMRARGAGHLVFIGSVAGRFPTPDLPVYGATKAAVSLFADALRGELAGERIRVTEIAPGRFRSNLYRDAVADMADELYDAYEPLEPEDIAEAVAFALDAPAHVNVSRMEIFPTSQVAGGSIVKKADMR